MAKKDINRIKIVLVENKRTAKWLADELGKDPATVSKWCTNSSQPSLETLVQVAEALDVDVRSLIVQTKKSRIEIEAEKLLNNYRLSFLETLRPTDTFAEDYIFYYGLKLKLISRIRQFDKLKGESAYKNIYYSIINGERLEAVQ